MGRFGQALSAVGDERTLLQREVDTFVRRMAVGALVIYDDRPDLLRRRRARIST